MATKLDFFLAASSSNSFVSFFSEITNPKMGYKSFILKGGPGTGKSSILKKIHKDFDQYEDTIETIHCSADPNSLDAVILNGKKACVVDGTAPHLIEPKYPGAVETTINLSDCWNENTLQQHKQEIIEAFDMKSKLAKRAQSFLNAANLLLKDNYSIALDNTNKQKAKELAKRLAIKELGKKISSKGVENKRLLSAATPQGIVTYTQTIDKMCEKTYIIKDDFGASSSIILDQIRVLALDRGYEIYTCYCPLNPHTKVEHVLIPQISVGFVTAHRFNNIDIYPYRVINFTRFTDSEALKLKKQRLNFNKKVAKELLNEACSIMNSSQKIHLSLEQTYINSMDFSLVDSKFNQLKYRLLQLYN